MTEVVLSLASEWTALLNFVFIDVLLLSTIMHISGLLAGHHNHRLLKRKRRLRLAPCNVPMVGGGLVTEPGKHRTFLIFLRLSVTAAALICNYGLEGRTFPVTMERTDLIRTPGPLLLDNGQVPSRKDDVFTAINQAAQLRLNCFHLDGEIKKYGLVANRTCYPMTTEDVVVTEQNIDLTEVDATAVDCEEIPDCQNIRTIFKCQKADMVCFGIRNQNQCPRKVQQLLTDDCEGLVYSSDSEEAFLCARKELRPEQDAKLSYCQRIKAKRGHIQGFVDYLRAGNGTTQLPRAVFAAAYGKPVLQDLRLPTESQKNVTVINLFWFIPIGWILFVALSILLWRAWYMYKDVPMVAHDEAGLTRILDRQIEGKYGQVEGWNESRRRRETQDSPQSNQNANEQTSTGINEIARWGGSDTDNIIFVSHSRS